MTLDLGGQSNRRQSSLTQQLPSTWQIAALYAFLAILRNDSGNLFVSLDISEGHSRARRAVEPGGQTSPRDDSRSLLQLLAQRGHLDVEGGRERDGSWRERKEEVEAPARKSLLDGRLCVTLGDGKE